MAKKSGHAQLPDAARAKNKSSTPITSDRILYFCQLHPYQRSRTADMGGADKNTKTSHSLPGPLICVELTKIQKHRIPYEHSL